MESKKFMDYNIICFKTCLLKCIQWIPIHPIFFTCQDCKISNPYEPFTIYTLANHNKLNALATTARLCHGGNKNFCTWLIDHKPK